MDIIEMKLAGERIAITLYRAVGSWTKTRHISAGEAFALSLLLTSEAQEQALNFEVDAGVSLQIENRPYDRAWLGIDDRYGGRKLVACLEGDLIREVGRCLRSLHITANNPSSPQSMTRTFRVEHCYLDE
ncbi:hypothetical protein [Sphingomonas sp. Leaf4]|uniref:hypothetical protein n=1 Tax=Sphingomonas sp. Leaf4 TaxID=2876553 RepID=UPI001E30E883|nr:hypothetical protein [Sphingomonas sp. Leaf4]